VPALLAGVLLITREDIHLAGALAEREPSKQVHGTLGWSPVLVSAVIEDGVAFRPEIFRDDRLYLRHHPFGFRLELPVLLVSGALRVVRAAGALGNGVTEKPIHSGVCELAAVSGAIARFVHQAGDRLLALVLNEE